MPTFSAIALDRLLEPGASSSADMTVPTSKPIPKPPQNPKLERRHSSTTVAERKVILPQTSPSLYTTPESTPLPDSPSSFPPSPYIVNHKRRGPRLLKSFSEANVSSRKNAQDKEIKNGDKKESVGTTVDLKKKGPVTFTFPEPIEENGTHYGPSADKHANGNGEEEHINGFNNVGEAESSSNKSRTKSFTNGLLKQHNVPKHVKLNVVERESESEDFYDPQESMSFASNTDTEDNTVVESTASARFATPMGEFFDAWDELSSESGRQPSTCDYETELREVRLSWLMEIERRKQAEEVAEDMRARWERIRRQLSTVGLTLPVDPTEPLDSDPGEDLCQQIYIARIVSETIGKAMVRAELEMEMEAQIESKNFEISRLSDRLKYYEAVNREMSQRNQEAVEMTRRDRHRKKRMRKWVWGSVGVAITLGTAALAWSYFPTSKGSPATDKSGAPERK